MADSVKNDGETPGAADRYSAMAEFSANLTKNKTARQKIDTLIARFPHKTISTYNASGAYAEGPSVEALVFELPGFSNFYGETEEALNHVRSKLGDMFPLLGRSSFLNAVPVLYFPLQQLRELSEEQCQAVIDALAPLVQRSVEMDREKKALEAVTGGLFDVFRKRRDTDSGSIGYFKIDQKCWDFDEGSGFSPGISLDTHYGFYRSKRLPEFLFEKSKKAPANRYLPLQHLTKCLNEALGEELFTGELVRRTGAGNWVSIQIKEDDVVRLFHHPKLDAVKKVFAHPLECCIAYEQRTLGGKAKRALGRYALPNAKVRAALSAPETISLPKPDVLMEPGHPADEKKGKFTEALRHSFNGISNGLG